MSLFFRNAITLSLIAVLLGALPTSSSSAADDKRSFFDGVEARNVGPFRGGRATVAVGVSQSPNIFYMGTTGGVWKTENAGASWFPVSDDDFGSSAVGAIAVAPSDPYVLFVGMGESPFRNIASSQGDGVYKSTDGGRSWSKVGFEKVRQIGEIRVHPTNSDTVWVAAQGNTYAAEDDGGVYKSTDGGQSWRRVLVPLNDTTGAVDLAIDPSNPRILYAAMWDNQRTPWALRSGGEGSGVWRSADGGEKWERLTTDLPEGMGKIGVAVSPAKAGRAWAIIEAEGDEGGLYRTDDGGDSWTQVNKERVLRARSWYYMHIFADPNDENTVYVLNAPFMKSIDGGKTFAQVETPHGDNHYLWINPENSQWMINANDGGANVSFDGGQSWSRQDNQPTAQFYRVNTDNAFEYRIYGGQQDNSTVAIRSRSRDGSIGRDDWEIHGGCESAYVAMDPENPRYTYAGCYLGLIDEFDAETRTSRSIKAYAEVGLGQLSAESRYRFNWNSPIHVSLHNPDVIYHGANVLLRTSDRGYSWTEVSPDLTRDEADKQGQGAGPYTNENIEQYNTIFAFAESPHDADTLWVGTDDGLLHVTRNGGDDWKDVTPRGVDRGLINSIEVSPHDPATAYVVIMNYKRGDNRPMIFRTQNYGRSWSSIDEGLPQEHFARVVREDPHRPGLLFAGMERGLFISFNSGDDWQQFQSNLPIVPITDLMLRQNDLVLATQGRAFWVVDDINPLRQFEVEHEKAGLHLYEANTAFRLTPTKGGFGGGESVAPSAPAGAVLYYALSSELDLEEESLVLEILDATGEVIREMKTDSETGVEGGGSGVDFALPAEVGVNRVIWDLRIRSATKLEYDVVYGAGPDKAIAGHNVAPGEYRVRMTLGDVVQEQVLTVAWDPAQSYEDQVIADQQDFVAEVHGMVNGLYTRIASLQTMKEQVNLRKAVAEKADDADVIAAAETFLESLDTWQTSVSTPARETFQDVLNFHPRIDAFLVDLLGEADDAVLGLTDGQRARLADLRDPWQDAIDRWNTLMNEDLPAFNAIAGPAVVAPGW
ncbi:MAG: hypothetical protein AAGG55_16835 [Pseudomonadota bacterium]